ncbi:MAG: hypothetical protein V4735_00140 [Pseudomonadota bacterium]
MAHGAEEKAAKAHGKRLGAALKAIREFRGYEPQEFIEVVNTMSLSMSRKNFDDAENFGLRFQQYASAYLQKINIEYNGLDAEALEKAVLDAASKLPQPIDRGLFSRALTYLLLKDEKIFSNSSNTIVIDTKHIPEKTCQFLGVVRASLAKLLADGEHASNSQVNKVVRNYRFASQQALLDAAVGRGFTPDQALPGIIPVGDQTEKHVKRVLAKINGRNGQWAI